MIKVGAQQGQLFIVATPIGNLDDISQRAIKILTSVAAIAVEDTRHSRKLLQHLSISTPMFALHEHNESKKIASTIERLIHGDNIALISDAGTPLISDPGYQLVRHARKHGIKVSPVPGASAIIAALSCAGLPSDRFTFEGFLPSKAGSRAVILSNLINEQRTLIFYEAPHRIVASLQDMKNIFGAERYVVLARELTKTFETIRGGSLNDILQWVVEDSNQQKGEFVVLVHGAEKKASSLDASTLKILDILTAELPLKQAAGLTAKITGLKKKVLYQAGLERKELRQSL